MKENEKIAVGWIDAGTVYSGFAAHLSNILLNRGNKISDVIVASGTYLSHNRNRLVNTFLDTEADWLLSLDSDLLIDVHSFDRLINTADSDLYPIVGGKYYLPNIAPGLILVSATEPDLENPVALAGKWLQNFDENANVIDNLHSVGLGYCLIHRKVFEQILKDSDEPYPWFKDEWHPAPISVHASDDIYFFNLVKKYDFNVAFCPKANSQHLKVVAVNDQMYLNVKDVFEQKNKELDMTSHKKKSLWVKGRR